MLCFSSGTRKSFNEDLNSPPRNNQVRCVCVCQAFISFKFAHNSTVFKEIEITD